MKKATFYGGPYDGIMLDHNDMNLYTRHWAIGVRTFLAMPPRTKWDDVRRGDLDKDGPFDEDCPIYELLHTPHGIECRYDDGGSFDEACREYGEERQVGPQVKFTGQYFKCYRDDSGVISIPDRHFAVIDEKDRQWVCVPVSKTEGEGGVAEMLSRMGGGPSSKPLRMVILHCEEKTELAAKLADQID